MNKNEPQIKGLGSLCPTTQKRQFETERSARSSAKELRKRKGARTKPYICPYCRYWHHGHTRPEHRRGPSKRTGRYYK